MLPREMEGTFLGDGLGKELVQPYNECIFNVNTI